MKFFMISIEKCYIAFINSAAHKKKSTSIIAASEVIYWLYFWTSYDYMNQ